MVGLRCCAAVLLTFKSLTLNDVDLCRKMLTSVLTFKLLVFNNVDLVDLYTRIYILWTKLALLVSSKSSLLVGLM